MCLCGMRGQRTAPVSAPHEPTRTSHHARPRTTTHDHHTPRPASWPSRRWVRTRLCVWLCVCGSVAYRDHEQRKGIAPPASPAAGPTSPPCPQHNTTYQTTTSHFCHPCCHLSRHAHPYHPYNPYHASSPRTAPHRTAPHRTASHRPLVRPNPSHTSALAPATAPASADITAGAPIRICLPAVARHMTFAVWTLVTWHHTAPRGTTWHQCMACGVHGMWRERNE